MRLLGSHVGHAAPDNFLCDMGWMQMGQMDETHLNAVGALHARDIVDAVPLDAGAEVALWDSSAVMSAPPHHVRSCAVA